MALSDTYLKSNLGRGRLKVEEKADRDGLWVRLSIKGAVTFFYRYRFMGKQDKMTIGSYPAISLKQAREDVSKHASVLAVGKNPKIQRELELALLNSSATFEKMFRDWFAMVESGKKCADQVMRSFELHVFPKVGKYQASEISLQRWIGLLDDLAMVYTGVTKRILNKTKNSYAWAHKRGMVENNPIATLTSSDFGIKTNVGERTLERKEIALIWRACDQSRMTNRNKALIKLCLFFGCRVSELRLAEKAHFDFEKMVWTVPPQNHKTGSGSGKPIIRPIIPDVVPLIKSAMDLAPGKYAFSNRTEPMPSGNHLSITGMLCKFMLKVYRETVPHFTVHDLRRTARTNWSELTEPHIAEMMLGHKLPGVWGVYDKHGYLDAMWTAYSQWWARLMGIVEPQVAEFKRPSVAS